MLLLLFTFSTIYAIFEIQSAKKQERKPVGIYKLFNVIRGMRVAAAYTLAIFIGTRGENQNSLTISQLSASSFFALLVFIFILQWAESKLSKHTRPDNITGRLKQLRDQFVTRLKRRQLEHKYTKRNVGLHQYQDLNFNEFKKNVNSLKSLKIGATYFLVAKWYLYILLTIFVVALTFMWAQLQGETPQVRNLFGKILGYNTLIVCSLLTISGIATTIIAQVLNRIGIFNFNIPALGHLKTIATLAGYGTALGTVAATIVPGALIIIPPLTGSSSQFSEQPETTIDYSILFAGPAGGAIIGYAYGIVCYICTLGRNASRIFFKILLFPSIFTAILISLCSVHSIFTPGRMWTTLIRPDGPTSTVVDEKCTSLINIFSDDSSVPSGRQLDEVLRYCGDELSITSTVAFMIVIIPTAATVAVLAIREIKNRFQTPHQARRTNIPQHIIESTDSNDCEVSLTTPPQRVAVTTGTASQLWSEVGVKPTMFFNGTDIVVRPEGNTENTETVTSSHLRDTLENIVDCNFDLIIVDIESNYTLYIALLSTKIPTFGVRFNSIADIENARTEFGNISGHPELSEYLNNEMENKLGAVSKRWPAPNSPKVSVVSTLTAARFEASNNSLIADIVYRIGANLSPLRRLEGKGEVETEYYTVDDLDNSDVDFVIFDCGSGIQQGNLQAYAEMKAIVTQRFNYRITSFVPIFLPLEHMMINAGMDVAQTATYISSKIYPSIFDAASTMEEK